MFVVIGMDSCRQGPSLAIGPFATYQEAQEMADLLKQTTSARLFVLTLHTPKSSREMMSG